LTPPDDRDRGETLVEVIIAIAIMGIAFVAILGGMLTAASMSGRHRTQSEGITQLVNAVEQVKQAPFDPSCAANPYAVTLDPGWNVVETIEYWNGTTYQPSCYDTVGASFLSQQVKITITSADGQVSLSQTVAKRR
jgi:type II secretory pathway pseudopilin PulG